MLTTYKMLRRLGPILIIIIGVGSCASVDSGVPRSNQPPAGSVTVSAPALPGSTDPNEPKIMDLIRTGARNSGEQNPTAIQWVYGTRGTLSELLDFGIPSKESDHQEVLVVANGSFSAADRGHRPRGEPAPTGTVLYVLLDVESWDVTDSGLRSTVPKMSSVGPVYTETS